MSKKEIKKHNIENESEKYWFSVIKETAKNMKYGKMEVTLTITGGKVVNLFTHEKNSYEIPK